MPGEYEPNDSRNVTGQSQQGMGAPGGADQQTGGERWGGDAQQSQNAERQNQMGQNAAAGQQQQFDSSGGGQMGSGQDGGMTTQMGGARLLSANEAADRYSGQLREHMEVIGADGVHVGTVDHVDGHRIKLTRKDSGMGSHQGHHHYLSCGLIAGVEGDKVRLSTTGANAQGMLEEE